MPRSALCLATASVTRRSRLEPSLRSWPSAGTATRRTRSTPGARAGLAGRPTPCVAARAEWVVGLAAARARSAGEAVASYRRAIDRCLAAGPGHPKRPTGRDAGPGPGLLAISLLGVGDANEANREMARARRQAPDRSGPVVRCSTGCCCRGPGASTTRMTTYRRAERQLERVDDQPSLARLRLNRGPLRVYQGDLDGALDDLDAAERMATAEDLPVLAAMAAHNTGFAEGRRGNLPTALEACDRAEAAYRRLENPSSADRGAAGRPLRDATCWPDWSSRPDSGPRRRHRGRGHRRPVSAGRVPPAAGPRPAGRRGTTARPPPRRPTCRRPLRVDQAPAVGRAGPLPRACRPRSWPPRTTSARPPSCSDAAASWPSSSTARDGGSRPCTSAPSSAVWPSALGRPAVARAELADAAAARRRGPAELRAQAWHAAALLSLAEGDRAGARRALTHGLGVIDRYRASLGATELRTGAAGHGAELARLGTRLALDDGRPAEVLRWAERWRAGALRRPAVRPPDDALVATELAELRAVDTEMREGRRCPGPTRDPQPTGRRPRGDRPAPHPPGPRRRRRRRRGRVDVGPAAPGRGRPGAGRVRRARRRAARRHRPPRSAAPCTSSGRWPRSSASATTSCSACAGCSPATPRRPDHEATRRHRRRTGPSPR